jgi:hypothetical protein
VPAPDIGPVDTPAPFTVGLTPNPTTIAMQTEISGWEEDVSLVVTRWYTATFHSLGNLDTTVTTTTGISTPGEIANAMIGTIAQPISYFRGLVLYMPNTWPYIFLILLMLAWVLFNIIAKLSVGVIAEVLEILRKLVELIPGF